MTHYCDRYSMVASQTYTLLILGSVQNFKKKHSEKADALSNREVSLYYFWQKSSMMYIHCIYTVDNSDLR